jgi:glycosyltransferase involved in cell wall biosynthesis
MSKNILFFTENKWAYGQIHNALIKRLWTHGIYSHILDWHKSYSDKEIELLDKKYDVFATSATVVRNLRDKGIDPSKIIAFAHAEEDLVNTYKSNGLSIFEGLRGIGVINPELKTLGELIGISSEIHVVRNGVDFDHYYAPIAEKLSTVGYAGASHHIVSDNTDCKRTHLLSRVMNGMDLNFVTHNEYSFLCMPGYYTEMDALLVTSNYEACGLPILEASAAGRLVVSPKVGYFDGSSGILCRLTDSDFVIDARVALEQHKDPSRYREACERAQQYARDNYDWKHTISGWVELLTK